MTGRLLHIDFETRSVCDLPKRNVYIYADDPTTDVWCAAWAFDDDEPRLWWPSEPCPPEIAEHVRAGGIVAAWNAAFERIMWRAILGPRYGWPVPALEQYRCVMVMAYALGLPGKLSEAAPALGIDVTKDMGGHALMLRMAKPRRVDPNGTIVWWNDAEKLERLGAYCVQDVKTEQACYRRLLPLRASEQQAWCMDQRMNDRGVFIDAALCERADAIAEATVRDLNAELRRVTGDEVRAVTNAAELIRFCKARGVETDSIAKDQLADLLVRDDLPADVRRALEIRQEGGKTSVAKVGKLLSLRQADGRMRGNLQFHGAGTGRWAARGAQLQNLPRPDGDLWRDHDLGEAIDDILAGRDHRYIEVMHGPPMTVVSDCIRGMIAAPPGRKILAADFSQIEARMTAWLGGQHDKLEVFRAFDAGRGPDVYTVQAGQIYGEPITKKDPRRQTGKVAVLSLGFQGGAMALLKMSKNYPDVDMAAAFPAVWAASSELARENAEDAWEQRGKGRGVGREAWFASELVKIAWRASNPAVVQRWRDCEAAAIAAVREPGTVHEAGRLRYRVAGSWLFCRLPSGRAMAYAYPKVEMKELPWNGPDGRPAQAPGLTFMGVNGITKRWEKQSAYGGLLFQNAVQAAARDIMVEALIRAEARGYEPVLTIHDEGVFEADEGFGSAEELCAIMVAPVAWADGLPIAADGFEAKRYRK